MAQLAIKGHPTRGKEVIEILKMLGGRNVGYIDTDSRYYYYINEYGIIYGTALLPDSNQFIIVTIESFLKKHPYKVGDKVIYNYNKKTYFIRKMYWKKDNILYQLSDETYTDGSSIPDVLIFDVGIAKLQPYKEETIKEKIKSFEILENYCADEVKIEFDPSKFEMVERKEGYYVVKKQPQYPKTYEECAKELGYNQVMPKDHILGYKGSLLSFFQQLLICRDAYWKIAGDWEPDWADNYQKKWIIDFYHDEIDFTNGTNVQFVLAFPTEEMRDAFYENFKDSIETCKELL